MCLVPLCASVWSDVVEVIYRYERLAVPACRQRNIEHSRSSRSGVFRDVSELVQSKIVEESQEIHKVQDLVAFMYSRRAAPFLLVFIFALPSRKPYRRSARPLLVFLFHPGISKLGDITASFPYSGGHCFHS